MFTKAAYVQIPVASGISMNYLRAQEVVEVKTHKTVEIGYDKTWKEGEPVAIKIDGVPVWTNPDWEAFIIQENKDAYAGECVGGEMSRMVG